jgi:hypothetical protein
MMFMNGSRMNTLAAGTHMFSNFFMLFYFPRFYRTHLANPRQFFFFGSFQVANSKHFSFTIWAKSKKCGTPILQFSFFNFIHIFFHSTFNAITLYQFSHLEKKGLDPHVPYDTILELIATTKANRSIGIILSPYRLLISLSTARKCFQYANY